MKQRNRKLSCLCIATALLAGANTTTVVAHESKDQVVEETYTLHTGAATAVLETAREEAARYAQELKEQETDTDFESQESNEESEITETELAVTQVESYLNIRNQPDLEGEVIGKLYPDSVGEIIGEEGEWLQISSGTVNGYIKAEYVLRGEEGARKAEEVGERQAKVEAVTLRLREAATTEARTVELLPQEEILHVQEEETEGWIKVASEVAEGYVSAEYVEVYTIYQEAESKEEEEARLKKEEEERLRAEAERAAQAAREAAQASAVRGQASSNTAKSRQVSSGDQSSQNTQSAQSSQASATTASGMGQSIANYALQFVGNPYVYGGTSLTNGADCSGFVMSVYKHFGINLPRTSGEQGKCGTNAGGLANAVPGDLVSYSGHIGIYIGNGQIVHASSAKTGIKVSNANYRTILSVRRIV